MEKRRDLKEQPTENLTMNANWKWSGVDYIHVTSYNLAIEAAASDLQKSYPDNVNTNAFAASVRSLKI